LQLVVLLASSPIFHEAAQPFSDLGAPKRTEHASAWDRDGMSDAPPMVAPAFAPYFSTKPGLFKRAACCAAPSYE
jgi:hypothetical protein